MKSRKKNKRTPPQQAREKTHDDPGAGASSKLAKELIDATEIVEGITGLRLLASGSSERRRTPWASAGGTLRKGDEGRSTAPIGGKILPVDIGGTEHDSSDEEDRLNTGHAVKGRGRERGPDYETSRQRVTLEDKLRSELGTIKSQIGNFRTVDELKKRFPTFHLWSILSAAEQQELLTEEFKPTAYARTLVMREFGLTNSETIKKDRQKLRKVH